MRQCSARRRVMQQACLAEPTCRSSAVVWHGSCVQLPTASACLRANARRMSLCSCPLACAWRVSPFRFPSRPGYVVLRRLYQQVPPMCRHALHSHTFPSGSCGSHDGSDKLINRPFLRVQVLIHRFVEKYHFTTKRKLENYTVIILLGVRLVTVRPSPNQV